MKTSIISFMLIVVLLSSCKKEQDPFSISKHNIGFLTDSTQVKDLNSAFPKDSVVTSKGDATFKIGTNMMEVYGTGGEKLLMLTPTKLSDSTATISNVRILDSRYKTEKGISTLSTFKDIHDSYKISKIDNLINYIVVSVNEINASFSIDKLELPANLRFDMNLNIEASQIPDNAKIKYFFLNWN